MTENDYRELFMALRLHPRWARKMLQYVRRQPGNQPYPQAVAAVRDRGVKLDQLAEDFGVSRGQASEIGKKALRELRRALNILPAEGHGLTREELLDQSVDVLDLPIRPSNSLAFYGVKTLRELVALTDRDLLKMKNLGRVSLKEIKKQLAVHGLSLRRWTWDDPPPMD